MRVWNTYLEQKAHIEKVFDKFDVDKPAAGAGSGVRLRGYQAGQLELTGAVSSSRGREHSPPKSTLVRRSGLAFEVGLPGQGAAQELPRGPERGRGGAGQGGRLGAPRPPSQGASSAPLGGASQETPPHRVLERGPPGTVLRAAAERVCTVRTGWILAPALSRSERAVVVGPLRQAKKDY